MSTTIAQLHDRQGVAVTLPDPTSLALNLPKTMSFDDWSALGLKLASTQRVLNWWIGDWWAAGHHRYGERARVAAEGIFGREFQTLMNAASVCRAFETSRRREALSYTHHAEVAALPTDRADALLDKAQAENLSARDMRRAAMVAKLDLGIIRPRDEVDDDPVYTALKQIAASWNRAPKEAREQFADMVAEAELGVIEV